MVRRILVPAVLILLLAPASLAQELSGRIVSLIRQAELGPDAVVGVSVVDCRSGQTVAEYHANDALQPASNQKLLTTGAALAILGPDFAFRTRVVQSGRDVVLIGDGDPALGDAEVLARMDPPMTVDDMLDALAGAIRDARIEGLDEIVVDDRVFDREAVHEGWPTDQLDRHYSAGVAGLNFHANVLAFYPAPGAGGPGSVASCEITPRVSWMPITIDAVTVERGRQHRYGVQRDLTQNRFRVYGQVSASTQVAARVAVHEPSTFLGRLLAFRLDEMGVTPGGARRTEDVLRQVRLAGDLEQFPVERTLAVVSTPLTDVVRRCNVDSVNLYAEALIKRIGHELTGGPGTWTSGAAAMRMLISERLGAEAAASTIISDGSGFSRGNLVEPAVLTAWMRSISNDPEFGDEFAASLPRIGEGTLESRFQRTPTGNLVTGKSGTITGVRCLSGFVTNEATGRRIAYSIMVNGLREGTDGPGNALRLHERIVGEIDSWLTRRVEAASANVGG
ncbi:MAG: D-alanyl-D-alanine carboxypeptidase/D-alanyl-D-alanine-endopeptidase [Phycisphaerales bacterium]|nr:D-alanyl-D-alanine carboxypeptidase/D-alanyl-D-alanine-endopeptidase [Phycisphaerales bacterium]MCB9841496.1 D-alanyl-D-alanine carboxypeptidase/D-alanyl-D-alanine-endopeptidase [Phycisphaeraceae bacterium]